LIHGMRMPVSACLDTNDAIWGCKSHGKCTEVCPKEIDVRKWLAVTKKKIYDAKQKQ